MSRTPSATARANSSSALSCEVKEGTDGLRQRARSVLTQRGSGSRLRQREEQMAAAASLSYLTDEFTAIDPEQSFYWNAGGDLVLVFDEYTVAAGYMGMVEFTIPRDVYSALLK